MLRELFADLVWLARVLVLLAAAVVVALMLSGCAAVRDFFETPVYPPMAVERARGELPPRPLGFDMMRGQIVTNPLGPCCKLPPLELHDPDEPEIIEFTPEQWWGNGA